MLRPTPNVLPASAPPSLLPSTSHLPLCPPLPIQAVAVEADDEYPPPLLLRQLPQLASCVEPSLVLGPCLLPRVFRWKDQDGERTHSADCTIQGWIACKDRSLLINQHVPLNCSLPTLPPPFLAVFLRFLTASS